MTSSLPTILSSFHFCNFTSRIYKTPTCNNNTCIHYNQFTDGFHKELGVITIFKVTAFSDRTRIIVSYIEPHGEVHCYQNDASNN